MHKVKPEGCTISLALLFLLGKPQEPLEPCPSESSLHLLVNSCAGEGDNDPESCE